MLKILIFSIYDCDGRIDETSTEDLMIQLGGMYTCSGSVIDNRHMKPYFFMYSLRPPPQGSAGVLFVEDDFEKVKKHIQLGGRHFGFTNTETVNSIIMKLININMFLGGVEFESENFGFSQSKI